MKSKQTIKGKRGKTIVKNKCNCLCHFKKPPTPEEYAVSSYYGCSHCRKPFMTLKGNIDSKIREIVFDIENFGESQSRGGGPFPWEEEKDEWVSQLKQLIKEVCEEYRQAGIRSTYPVTNLDDESKNCEKCGHDHALASKECRCNCCVLK